MTDDQWNYTFHCPIHSTRLYLIPMFSYSYGFRFDAEVMDGFFECFQRMVPSAVDHTKISQESKHYKRAMGTFGFQMEKNDRQTVMPCKLHLVAVKNMYLGQVFPLSLCLLPREKSPWVTLLV